MEKTMEFHEYADIFPMMNDEEFAGLLADMERNGFRPENPIIVYEGKILDGRNRYRASEKLGLKPITKKYDGKEPIDFVVSQNLTRRHLTPDQLAMAALDVEAVEAKRAKERQKLSEGRGKKGSADQHYLNDKGKAAEKAAKKVGASTRKVQRAKALAKADKKLAEDVKNGKIALKDAEKRVKGEKKAQERKEKLASAPTAPVWVGEFETGKIYVSDVTTPKFLKQLPEDSVDLIVTDPPWDEASLRTYEAAAQIAKRALKPGHFMAIYSGKMFLPDIMDILRRGLEYVWTFSVFQPDSNDKIQKYHLYSAWRPVILVKKPGKTIDMVWMPDSIKSTRDKHYHEWGQGVELVERLVKGYSQPGEIVLDPFIGGASVPYVAKELKRRYIGFDISEDSVRLGLQRLS